MGIARALFERTGASQPLARKMLTHIFDGLEGGCIQLSQPGYPSIKLGDTSHQKVVDIQIQDPSVIARILRGGSIAAGESYIEGAWRCSDLHALLQLIAENQHKLDKLDGHLHWLQVLLTRLQHYGRRNHKQQAKKNILAHYDLGNPFYQGFLDPAMQYSSALYYSDGDSLELAQQHKLQRICEQLQLDPDDHLLEIGTGWGGLACYAAQHFGCRVTTTTISDEQFAFACDKVKQLDLQQQVTVLNKDYRELEGSFDKLVSIEMIEAVGERYLQGFIDLCAQRLKSGGIMVLQAITIADHRFASYRNSVDFIQQHVFPGGFLPSPGMLSDLLRSQFEYLNNLEMGLSYAQTLKHWHHRVIEQRREQSLGAQFDDAFYRLWHFYFAYCEAGFRTGNIGTCQLTLRRR
ncbi:SAM-dependent methyltransferase [Aliagarivorans marinus]|uniref:SAM-dependent methyltransferase n=1 Tax=Aliagarivorans marinus TaxID=561965 RepID=UPI0003F62BCC|nr:cyclopropane-fatty-acyl-phospholipid synthase family protein [Aliagarivorans marinus]